MLNEKGTNSFKVKEANDNGNYYDFHEPKKAVSFLRRYKVWLIMFIGGLVILAIILGIVLPNVSTAAPAGSSSSNTDKHTGDGDNDDPKVPDISGESEWWKKAVIYQIYPRSFQDSNGDGIGDLKGITSRADYLKDLGIQAVWISPIYASPMNDYGYDISNFIDIAPMFGTLGDFREMAEAFKKRGIRLVMDFVPNHASEQHPFFLISKQNRTNQFHDYFVWHDGIECPPNTETTLPKCPPNSWTSVFSGSMWTWSPERQQFYLHQFLKEQPDFNYRNPNVRKYMLDTLRFWLDQGVDGFRIDAVSHLAEDDQFRENTFWDNCDHNDFGCMKPIYTSNQPLNYEIVREWTDMFREYSKQHNRSEVFSVTEAGSGSMQELFRYESEGRVAFTFNFDMIGINPNTKAPQYRDMISGWIRDMPKGSWPNWVMGNHDQNRIASKLGGSEYADVINTLLLLLPGTPTCYNGDELGMVDTVIPPDKIRDPAPQNRDPERTPMHWTPNENANFTTGEPWLPLGDHVTINVHSQLTDSLSHLSIFKRLMQLRKEAGFADSVAQMTVRDIVDVSDNVLLLLRGNKHDVSKDYYAVLINIGKADVDEKVDLRRFVGTTFSKAEIVLTSGNLDAEVYAVTNKIDVSNVTLRRAQVLVLKLIRDDGAAIPVEPPVTKNDNWWERTPIYQIYPRSFQDSNGDGVGDLKGIISRVGYLDQLGVRAVWLSPVFKSPMKDFGYDISDFRNIELQFGTITDFEDLMKAMKAKGIRIIMDFVPNHSSDQHAWFQNSRKDKTNEFSDFYVWRDGKTCHTEQTPPTGSTLCPPNNWVSNFDGPAWTWEPGRQQFYLHQFLPTQPDLNYRNQKVIEEMGSVLEFWMEKGIDGFRMDAVKYMVEDMELSDEEFHEKCDKTKYSCMKTDHTVEQPETLVILKQWTKLLEDYGSRNQKKILSVGEAYATPEFIYKLQTDGGLQFSFNFNLLNARKDTDARGLQHMISDWVRVMDPRRIWPNWVIGDHDVSRIAKKMGGDRFVDLMNTLLLLLPGTPTVYYGDEIGMTDVDVPEDRKQDPSPASRDPERSPMQWDTTTSAGFSSAGNTWLPVNENHKTGVNVKDQEAKPRSHLNQFKQLLSLRKLPAFSSSAVDFTQRDVVEASKNVLLFLRGKEYIGDRYGVVVCVGEDKKQEQEKVNLEKLTGYEFGEIVFRSDGVKDYRANQFVALNDVRLKSGDALVFRLDHKRPETNKVFVGSFADAGTNWEADYSKRDSEKFKSQGQEYINWLRQSLTEQDPDMSAEISYLRPWTAATPGQITKVTFRITTKAFRAIATEDVRSLLLKAKKANYSINAIHDVVDEWWKTIPLYQIYPRSFKDSNGDGIGDIKGISSKLDYLIETGIRAIWLSPVYKSPMVDNGYDIEDFRDIDSKFGSMDDFLDLAARLKDNGMYLVMDWVPNHSSDKHIWFQESRRNRTNRYTDWFVWHDGKTCDDKQTPPAGAQLCSPNNWNSAFNRPAWTWVPERQQYYLHQFYPQQPDLNYRNPEVQQEMKDTLRFWLDKGVDGFRIDAISHLFEDKEFRNNPENPDPNRPTNPLDWNYYSHVYNYDQPETLAEVRTWTDMFREYGQRTGRSIYSVAEIYTSLDVVMKYYTEARVTYPFNMKLVTELNDKSTAGSIQKAINEFMDAMPLEASAAPNWVVGNHDQRRVATRLGGEKYADVANTLLLTLPGSVTAYNGDELGMINNENVSIGDPLDREKARTPMQWDETENAGFTVPDGKPWLEANENFKAPESINVESELNKTNSHLNIFKQLLKMRENHKAFQDVEQKIEFLKITGTAVKDVLGYIRGSKLEGSFVILLDFGHSAVRHSVDVLAEVKAKLGTNCQIIEVRREISNTATLVNPADAESVLSNIDLTDADMLILKVRTSCL